MVPVSCACWHALLLGGHDIEGHHRQHRAVHGHGHRHLIQRNPVEQDLRVQDRVDGHARLADIADHARMIRVIAAMGGQIEGDGQALLPGGQIAAVEGVALLGGGETGILAHRPGTHHVHGRIGTAQERWNAGQIAQMLQRLDIVPGVQGLDIDLLHGPENQFLQRFPRGLFDRRAPLFEAGRGEVLAVIHAGEIRCFAHDATPVFFCRLSNSSWQLAPR